MNRFIQFIRKIIGRKKKHTTLKPVQREDKQNKGEIFNMSQEYYRNRNIIVTGSFHGWILTSVFWRRRRTLTILFVSA